ncbi:hypothetical protein NHX12_025468 [Muraenolepis orangiensis]|uniref:Uncharacterized protein n=1 Tax=Muraenolepis orangiensis TaxID=630683 RepID=A0A9Q0EK76_9TELE|nr:hypothetical protein NHX12_025468 [Muraenolepis orangiensis]
MVTLIQTLLLLTTVSLGQTISVSSRPYVCHIVPGLSPETVVFLTAKALWRGLRKSLVAWASQKPCGVGFTKALWRGLRKSQPKSGGLGLVRVSPGDVSLGTARHRAAPG